ncbi:hypothetical protein GCM10009753_09910 [Streptantibioticus ferralitis]
MCFVLSNIPASTGSTVSRRREKRGDHGHLMAAAALTVPGDLGTPPPRERADSLAGLSDEAWGRLRLGPGWTAEAAEGPTP